MQLWSPVFKKGKYEVQGVTTSMIRNMQSTCNVRKVKDLGLLALHIEIKR